MNDRFRFRFWYKLKNHYLNTEKLVLNNGTYTQVSTKQMNNGFYYSYIVGEYNTFEIIPEQCSGLKDKNGKLIYEADIVDNGSTKSEVIFENGAFRFKYNNQPIGGWFSKELEIIGNIHENPELLKESK